MAESDQMTIIAGDTQIKGEMRFERAARLLGKFEGLIEAKGELHVADGALCKADVQAGAVQVDGTIEGNIAASDKVQLNGKAKMRGDIVATKLITAEGASLVGHVNIGPDAAKQSARPAPTQPGKPEGGPKQ